MTMEQQKDSDPEKETAGESETNSSEDRTERFLNRLDIQHKVLSRLLKPPYTDQEYNYSGHPDEDIPS
jgi:hypothetical protein